MHNSYITICSVKLIHDCFVFCFILIMHNLGGLPMSCRLAPLVLRQSYAWPDQVSLMNICNIGRCLTTTTQNKVQTMRIFLGCTVHHRYRTLYIVSLSQAGTGIDLTAYDYYNDNNKSMPTVPFLLSCFRSRVATYLSNNRREKQLRRHCNIATSCISVK